MSPTVQVDDDVYAKLKEHAEPFVDTPNSVLRRLLGLGDALPTALVLDGEPEARPNADVSTALGKRRSQQRTVQRKAAQRIAKRTRVPSGSILPQSEYELPLLQILADLGGSAAFRDVVEHVGVQLKPKLTELDLTAVSSGVVRWENRLQFVRLDMIKRGLMVKDSGRGIWAISDEGRQYLADHVEGGN